MTAGSMRAKLLGSKKFRERTVEVEIGGETVKVLVRQPTVAQRNAIMGEVDPKQAGKMGQDKITRLQAQSVILCCLDPVAKTPIFEEADLADLAEQPAGSWVDRLANEVMELITEGVDAAKN